MELFKRVDKILFFVSESIYFIIYLCYKSAEWLKENKKCIFLSLFVSSFFIVGLFLYLCRIEQIIRG